jgi:Acetyltransferase (isoleucine patch superfamily)
MHTEKEKMLAGELYNAGDAELIARWHLAKKLTKEYNNADTEDRELLDDILTRLLGAKGENAWIAQPFHVDYGENIYLGNNVEINMDCVFLDCNRITIGDHSGIGPGTHIYAVSHPVDPNERLAYSIDGSFSFWQGITAPITLGRNVWIGGRSIIFPGVTIGDNTTIGAGSVVTKSIPAGCLAAGNPCKVIRSL